MQGKVIRVVDKFVESDDTKLQSKGFNLKICSLEGQCANHYAIKSSAIAIIFKLTLVYAWLFFCRIH